MRGKIQGRIVILRPDAKATLAVWLMELQRTGEVTRETVLFAYNRIVLFGLYPEQWWGYHERDRGKPYR